MTRDEKIALLNRLLHGTVNSVVQYIDIATPYVPPFCEGKAADLKRMRDEQAHAANEIVAMIGELEGVPQVEAFPYWNVDLNYLDVRFLARFAGEHEKKVAKEIEEALPELRDDPRVHAALTRLLQQRRAHVAGLEAIAAIPSPAPDPERVKKAVPAESQNVPRPARAAAKPAPRPKA